MELVVIACGGCGAAIRIRHPEFSRRRVCPRCRTALPRGDDSVRPQGSLLQSVESSQSIAEDVSGRQRGRNRRLLLEAEFLPRPNGIVISTLLLSIAAILGAWTSASRSATNLDRDVPPLPCLPAHGRRAASMRN